MKKTSIDEIMIARCIKLSKTALKKGDAPFGCVITDNMGKIFAQGYNRVRLDNDVTHHAEINAMRKAMKKHGLYDMKKGGYDFSAYTLYSNCEPCPMCSFMIRELKFGKVVFAVHSKIMGGLTRWNILRDTKLETLVPFFRTPPKIITGVLKEQALDVYRSIHWDRMFE